MTALGTVLRLDDLTVDLARRKAYRDRREIPLSALSFDTLKALIETAPAPLTAEQLIEHAWRGAVVSGETVTQRIRLLRRALGDDRSRPRYIETLRGVGYRLIPPVMTLPTASRSRRTWSVPAAVAALVGLAAGFGYLLTQDGPAGVSGERPMALPQGPVTAAELAGRAKDLVRQRNPESLRHAIALYEEALAAEPRNGDLLASLSLALSTSVAWYGDSADVASRSERLARRALEGGEFFAAELALGFSLDAQGRVEPARAAYERAVAIDPDHYGARASLAYLLQVKGRLVEALSHNMMAMERAPPGALDVQVASCLRLLGFQAAASQWLQRADRLDPDSAHAAPARALDLMTRGELDEARRVIDAALARGVRQVELYEYEAVLAMLEDDLQSARRAIESAPPALSHRGPFEVWLRVIDALAHGADEQAIEKSDALLAGVAAGDTWPENFLYAAMLDAAAGRNARAFAALERLEAAGYRDYRWLELLPPLEALRGEPAFDRILSGMRADVDRQRAQVLATEWLPLELRTAALTP